MVTIQEQLLLVQNHHQPLPFVRRRCPALLTGPYGLKFWGMSAAPPSEVRGQFRRAMGGQQPGPRRRPKKGLGAKRGEEEGGEDLRKSSYSWDSPKEENSKEIEFIRGPFWFSPLSKVFYGLRVNCLLDPDRQCTLLQSPTFSTFKGFLGTSKRLSEAFLALQRLSIFAPAGGDKFKSDFNLLASAIWLKLEGYVSAS